MGKYELIEFAIKKYGSEIRAIVKKYYIPNGNSEDLFQEALIGVIEGVNSYDLSRGDENSESFKKFILMCAKRQILDAIKKSNRKKNEPLNNYVVFDKSLDNLSSVNLSQSNPEDDYIEKESIKEKNEDIKLLLSKSEREVLDLYLDGNSQSKIAIILGKTVKSVDNTLQRVKNKLKERNK